MDLSFSRVDLNSSSISEVQHVKYLTEIGINVASNGVNDATSLKFFEGHANICIT